MLGLRLDSHVTESLPHILLWGRSDYMTVVLWWWGRNQTASPPGFQPLLLLLLSPCPSLVHDTSRSDKQGFAA